MGRSVDTKHITEITSSKGQRQKLQYVKAEHDQVSFALTEGKQSELIRKIITYEYHYDQSYL